MSARRLRSSRARPSRRRARGRLCHRDAPAPIPDQSRSPPRPWICSCTRWHAFTDFRALADINVERGDRGSGSTGSSCQGSGQRPLRGPVALRPANPDRRRPRGQAHRLRGADERGVVRRRHGGDHARWLGLPFGRQDLAACSRATPCPRVTSAGRALAGRRQGPVDLLVGCRPRAARLDGLPDGVVSQLKIIGEAGRSDGDPTSATPPARLTGFESPRPRDWVSGTVRYRTIAVGSRSAGRTLRADAVPKTRKQDRSVDTRGGAW